MVEIPSDGRVCRTARLWGLAHPSTKRYGAHIPIEHISQARSFQQRREFALVLLGAQSASCPCVTADPFCALCTSLCMTLAHRDNEITYVKPFLSMHLKCSIEDRAEDELSFSRDTIPVLFQKLNLPNLKRNHHDAEPKQ